MENVVESSDDGAVLTVSLNRAATMNALSSAVWLGLEECFYQASADRSLRCVILRGAGHTVFSSGADIGELGIHRGTVAQAKSFDQLMRRALASVAACPHPVVAQIYGPCLGAGLALAANCDLRLAGSSARFGVPIGRLGLVHALSRIGCSAPFGGKPARMLDLLLEGRVITANEALAIGLVQRVVDNARAGQRGANHRRADHRQCAAVESPAQGLRSPPAGRSTFDPGRNRPCL